MSDIDPREAFAEAAANGAVHPALVAYLADLDDRLDKLVNPPDEADDAGDDAGDQAPAKPDASGTGRKATPATVAGKGGVK